MGASNPKIEIWRHEVAQAINSPANLDTMQKGPGFWTKLLKIRQNRERDQGATHTDMYNVGSGGKGCNAGTGDGGENEEEYSMARGSEQSELSVLVARKERLERAARLLKAAKAAEKG